jgi:chaperonin GroEL (HSP60 family)
MRGLWGVLTLYCGLVVVNAVSSLDQQELNEKLIGVKKVAGGGLQDSLFVNGVAFKKTVRCSARGY